MRSAVFERFGEPTEVLQARDVPEPHPGPGEVRVRMIMSPINPSDLLVVRGRYGVLPTLPATPGFEGVGVVDEVGPGLMGPFLRGRRVVAINGDGGNWAEYAVIPWRQARPLPSDISDEQAAAFFINPATVLALARHLLGVRRGEWLLQSAAGSTLGRMVIRLGRHDGFKTLNVVRRRDAIAELKDLGGDAVISDEDGPIDDQVRKIVGGEGVRHAIDPVGGETGTAILRSVAPDGRLILYGTLSGQPIQIDPRLLISGKRTVIGFWLGYWMRERSIPAALLLFREIASLIRRGVLRSDIGRVYPLDEIRAAAHQADSVARQGKVLVRL
jgi:NADPH:quinone reductase-like Zn-dependent oxidoreductase